MRISQSRARIYAAVESQIRSGQQRLERRSPEALHVCRQTSRSDGESGVHYGNRKKEGQFGNAGVSVLNSTGISNDSMKWKKFLISSVLWVPLVLPPTTFPTICCSQVFVILDLIHKSKLSRCQLHPLLSVLVISYLSSLLPLTCHIILLSPFSGIVVSVFKTAVDSLISDLIRMTLLTTHSHLTQNSPYKQLQSSFCLCHNTETVLIQIINDVLMDADSASLSILILLDLSLGLNT